MDTACKKAFGSLRLTGPLRCAVTSCVGKGFASDLSSTSLVTDDLPSPLDLRELERLVDEARGPALRQRVLGKDRSQANYAWRSTLRGCVRKLTSTARHRDMLKARQSTIDHNYLLDLIVQQRGLCAYSGVPMEMFRPNSHWRISLERIDTSVGYVKGNCCLIAQEFNSTVTKGTQLDLSKGSAQWSRHKVEALVGVRSQVPQMQHSLLPATMCSRPRPVRKMFRGPDEHDNFLCTRCGSWKARDRFYPRLKGAVGLQSMCKECESQWHLAYRGTLRGHAHSMLCSARQRALRGVWSGTFSLDLSDLLNMLSDQEGRCYYSGVPLHCARGPADWVWSLERLDNSATYTRDNCVLIAQEFNTPDQSRNKSRYEVFGTAQWSRSKVRHIWGSFWPDDGISRGHS
ncbi:y01B [Symbiodinium natans]|uniref:Y01B protein n=1 Tax=Symbiodinium natans TaxID=878477 RepID=A0A812PKQ9_9DINO|nr:y01B [Symbiodinium natans]